LSDHELLCYNSALALFKCHLIDSGENAMKKDLLVSTVAGAAVGGYVGYEGTKILIAAGAITVMYGVMTAMVLNGISGPTPSGEERPDLVGDFLTLILSNNALEICQEPEAMVPELIIKGTVFGSAIGAATALTAYGVFAAAKGCYNLVVNTNKEENTASLN